jgi:hypothetical protein
MYVMAWQLRASALLPFNLPKAMESNISSIKTLCLTLWTSFMGSENAFMYSQRTPEVILIGRKCSSVVLLILYW